jgi:SsrA-binding protein
MTKPEHSDLVSNRRATYNYEIIETFEAGIVLQGTEIKSLRDHGGVLQDSYVKVMDDGLWLVNSSIAPYRFGSIHNHEERRERKLLMHKREITRLKSELHEKGLTVIPLAMYLKKGRVKVRIATARGKKNYDKRESIKSRDEKRNIDRAMKEHQ